MFFRKGTNVQQQTLGVRTEVECRCRKSHPALMQISSSRFAGWEQIFSHPSWMAAVFSPPATASSSSVSIDKTKHQPVGTQMNGEAKCTRRSDTDIGQRLGSERTSRKKWWCHLGDSHSGSLESQSHRWGSSSSWKPSPAMLRETGAEDSSVP